MRCFRGLLAALPLHRWTAGRDFAGAQRAAGRAIFLPLGRGPRSWRPFGSRAGLQCLCWTQGNVLVALHALGLDRGPRFRASVGPRAALSFPRWAAGRAFAGTPRAAGRTFRGTSRAAGRDPCGPCAAKPLGI